MSTLPSLAQVSCGLRSDDSESTTTTSHLQAIRREILQIDRYEPPFADRSIINLSLNEHYALPSPRVRQALRELDPMRLVTYDTELAAELKAAIAAREGVATDNVLLAAGSSSALHLLLSSLSKGPLLLPAICWSYYLSLSRICGLSTAEYSMIKRSDRFDVDEGSVVRAIRRHAPALSLFINPHMPTGALANNDFLLECAESSRQGVILVDEAYHGFSPAMISIAPRVLDHPNLIVSRTFSKAFGLAGIRIGYLIASAPVIAELDKAAPPFSVPFVSASLALAALESEPYYRAQAVELMAVKVEFARRVQQIPGVQPYLSHGNFLLVELADAEAASRAEREIKAAGVAVRSARSYGLPSLLRISVGPGAAMARVASVLEGSQRCDAAI